jgi:hypothetical protein
MQKTESGPLMLLEMASKVIREDSVLKAITDMKEFKKMSNDRINSEMANSIVVTSYGNTKKTYRVEKIDFERSIIDTFKMGKPGEEVELSFA